MNNHYVYYTFKNNEPDKVYVGMTIKDIETGYKGSGKYIISAIKKYGKESFTRINLGVFDNREEAHYWEGFYIKLFKSESKYGGYNLSPKGGRGISIGNTLGKIYKIRKDKGKSRPHLSIKFIGNTFGKGNKGKQRPDVSKRFKGIAKSEEHKQNMKHNHSNKGKPQPWLKGNKNGIGNKGMTGKESLIKGKKFDKILKKYI